LTNYLAPVPQGPRREIDEIRCLVRGHRCDRNPWTVLHLNSWCTVMSAWSWRFCGRGRQARTGSAEKSAVSFGVQRYRRTRSAAWCFNSSNSVWRRHPN